MKVHVLEMSSSAMIRPNSFLIAFVLGLSAPSCFNAVILGRKVDFVQGYRRALDETSSRKFLYDYFPR